MLPHPHPIRRAATVPARMDDEEIDELILSRLRQRRAQQAGARTASAADLATFFNEPEPRCTERCSQPRPGLAASTAHATRRSRSAPCSPSPRPAPKVAGLRFPPGHLRCLHRLDLLVAWKQPELLFCM